MNKVFRKVLIFILSILMITSIVLPSYAASGHTYNVSGIPIYTDNSVSYSYYNEIASYLKTMPSYLRNSIKTISLVYDLTKYSSVPADSCAFTIGQSIYINANYKSSLKNTLYHEAGHALDYINGYSNTASWKSICNSEWQSEGYYKSQVESFAEAISRYYVDGLSKTKTINFIKQIINNGYINDNDGFTYFKTTIHSDNDVDVYSKPKEGYVVKNLDIGSNTRVIGISSDNQWYKIVKAGYIYYVKTAYVSFGRDEKTGPVQVLLLDGQAIDILAYDNTYKSIFNYIDRAGYSNYTVKNSYGSTIYSWYSINEDGVCYLYRQPKDPDSLPTTGSYPTVKFTLSGNTYSVKCTSGTYKEVFNKITSILGHSDYTVKNKYNTTVYSWYNISSNDTCKISTSTTSSVYTKTFTLSGNSYSIKCTSGTYLEVFNKIKSILGHNNFTVKDAWGSTVYSWYNVTSSGKITIK